MYRLEKNLEYFIFRQVTECATLKYLFSGDTPFLWNSYIFKNREMYRYVNFWHVRLWHNLHILNFNQWIHKTNVCHICIHSFVRLFIDSGPEDNVTIQETKEIIAKYGTGGRKNPICNKLMGETPFGTLRGRMSPIWTKWRKQSQIEHACGIFSPIWEK